MIHISVQQGLYDQNVLHTDQLSLTYLQVAYQAPRFQHHLLQERAIAK